MYWYSYLGELLSKRNFYDGKMVNGMLSHVYQLTGPSRLNFLGFVFQKRSL